MKTELIKNILVYLDGTEDSMAALQYAIILNKALSLNIFVVYVINTSVLNDLLRSHIFVVSEQKELQNDLEDSAVRYLRMAKEWGRKKGIEIQTISVQGMPSIEIKKIIREKEIDLLLVGRTPIARSRRDELKDEIDFIIRSLPCSLLLISSSEKIDAMYEALL